MNIYICIYVYIPVGSWGEREREWSEGETRSLLLLTVCQLGVEGLSLVDLGLVEPPPPVGC